MTFFNIEYIPDFLNKSESLELFSLIEKKGKWPHDFKTKKGVLSKKRNKCTYGEIKNYHITYRGQEIASTVYDWSEMPILKQIRDRIKELTGQQYHVCTIQYYNNGDVGIKPHRDKEMKPGTIIASISLGETRVMQFNRNEKELQFPLEQGSLFLIKYPTNDFWLHSIPNDNTKKPRISLIFRNCENMIETR
jgi:alkylated DNA repair dioxygenase AlkB